MTTTEFWSVAEAADHVGCTPETIRKAIRTNQLAAYTAQGVRGYRVRPKDVKAWLKPKPVHPEGPPVSASGDSTSPSAESAPGGLPEGSA